MALFLTRFVVFWQTEVFTFSFLKFIEFSLYVMWQGSRVLQLRVEDGMRTWNLILEPEIWIMGGKTFGQTQTKMLQKLVSFVYLFIFLTTGGYLGILSQRTPKFNLLFLLLNVHWDIKGQLTYELVSPVLPTKWRASLFPFCAGI